MYKFLHLKRFNLIFLNLRRTFCKLNGTFQYIKEHSEQSKINDEIKYAIKHEDIKHIEKLKDTYPKAIHNHEFKNIVDKELSDKFTFLPFIWSIASGLWSSIILSESIHIIGYSLGGFLGVSSLACLVQGLKPLHYKNEVNRILYKK